MYSMTDKDHHFQIITAVYCVCVCVYCTHVGNKSEINDMYIIFSGAIGEKLRYLLNTSNPGRTTCYSSRLCESHLTKTTEGSLPERKPAFLHRNKSRKSAADPSSSIFASRNKPQRDDTVVQILETRLLLLQAYPLLPTRTFL